MYDHVALVGATGAVGRIVLDQLARRAFPYKRLRLLASERSAGTQVQFGDQTLTVELLQPSAFEGVDLAIGSTPDAVAKDFVPWAVAAGASWSTKAATGGWTRTCRWSCPK